MDFAFTDEQEQLRAAARSWLADRLPAARLAEIADSDEGQLPGVWAELVDLGWTDPSLDSVDTAVLFEETGAALLPAPLFATLALGLPGADRSVASTLAWAEHGTDAIGAPAATRAVRSGGAGSGRVTLSGAKTCVPDVAAAQVIHVVADDGVYAVEAGAAGVGVTPRSTLDRTRRLADLTLSEVAAERVAGLEALDGVRRQALAAAAAEAVGVAREALRRTVAHAASREQFGRVIGTYQAVSHRLADSYAQLELARSLAYWASWCVASPVAVDPAEAETACAAAKSAAGATALAGCETAIQLHGGIGFTWDAGLHRYYKRAQWLEGFGGGGAAARRDVAAAILDR